MERRGKKDNFLSRSSPTGLKPNSNPQKKSKKIRLSEISTPKRKKGSRRRSKSPPPSLVRFNSLNMAKIESNGVLDSSRPSSSRDSRMEKSVISSRKEKSPPKKKKPLLLKRIPTNELGKSSPKVKEEESVFPIKSKEGELLSQSGGLARGDSMERGARLKSSSGPMKSNRADFGLLGDSSSLTLSSPSVSARNTQSIKNFFSFGQWTESPPFSMEEEENSFLQEGEEGESGFRLAEYQIFGDDYESIVLCLIDMPIHERKSFFIGIQDSFGIELSLLFESMKEMFSVLTEENDFDQRREEIVKLVILWQQTMGRDYQTHNSSLAIKIEKFLASLDQSLIHLLVGRPSLSFCSCGRIGQVAQNLTAIMFREFKKVQLEEFIDGSWEKKDRYLKSPNLMVMVENFNRIASMVVESILFCEESSRLQNLVYAIKLTNQLLKINNFDGSAAVISGLNQSSIRRLRPLWKKVNHKFKKRLEELEEFFSPKKNFKKYRCLLQTAEPPILPWLSPKLRELRYLYDGNQIETKAGYVNLPHVFEIGQSIKSFLKYQERDFEPPIGESRFLIKFIESYSVPEEICYRWSLFLVPRPTRSPPSKVEDNFVLGDDSLLVRQKDLDVSNFDLGGSSETLNRTISMSEMEQLYDDDDQDQALKGFP